MRSHAHSVDFEEGTAYETHSDLVLWRVDIERVGVQRVAVLVNGDGNDLEYSRPLCTIERGGYNIGLCLPSTEVPNTEISGSIGV